MRTSRRAAALAPLVAILVVVLAAVPTLPAAGSEDGPSVLVDVEKSPALNQIIRVTYTFTGPGTGASFRAPPLVPLKNLALVQGPSTSTQISFVNGNLSRSVSLTYFLRAKETGPAEIGEVHFLFGEKVVKAAAQTLNVEPARAGGPGVVGASDGGGEDPFPFQRIRPSMRPQREAYVEYVATPDKGSAFVGEPVTLVYELVTEADIEGLEYVDPPKYPGCWAEDLEKVEKPVGRRDVVDGRPVTRFTLLRKAVAGLAPGNVTLPAARIRLAVRGAGDPFADPFSIFQRRVVERATRAITLKVLPIPGNARFRGPVGRFELTSRVDRTKVTAGDALTLKVRLAGTGNLKSAAPEPPRIDIPNARVYPPTTRSEQAKGRAGGVLEWDYVVVPSAGGALTIPSASLEVFDPSEKRIVTKASAPITIAVEGGAPAAVLAASALPGTAPGDAERDAQSGSAETIAPEEVAEPATGAPAASGTAASTGTVDFERGTVTLPLWALAAVPVALLVLFGSALAMKGRAKRNEPFRAALAREPDETKERAAARVDRALREWLLARHGIPDGLSAASIDAQLAERGAPDALRNEVRELLAELEFLRFAPQLGDYSAKIEDVRRRAARLLPRLK